jgi:hypothetical protein
MSAPPPARRRPRGSRRSITRSATSREILIADSMLSLLEIGVSLPLAELYEGIVFETEQDADRTADGEPV